MCHVSWVILPPAKLPPSSNALTVRAEPFTEVPEYGSRNDHLGAHEEGVVKIGFTPRHLLIQMCLLMQTDIQIEEK